MPQEHDNVYTQVCYIFDYANPDDWAGSMRPGNFTDEGGL
jgi:hypothetical protein